MVTSVLIPRDRVYAKTADVSGMQSASRWATATPGGSTLYVVPETSYATCGDLSLAYQVFGDGPVELVFAGSFVSHVELCWTVPECVAFFERLSTFCRVLLFDKAGVGLSDPVPHVRTVDERTAELEAIMDAVGFRKAVIFGASESGPAAMMFAATRPERSQALILSGTFAYFGFAGWDDFDRDPAELRARLVPEMGEDYTPSVKQLAGWQAWGRGAGSAWGRGEATHALLPSVGSIRLLGMVERMSASPGMARAALEAAFRIDVRPILPTITVPTLVIPCPRRSHSGAGGPVHRRPHSRCALARSRGQGPLALALRSRQNPDRD